jgi:endonuclease YncB( thermonuclease family)
MKLALFLALLLSGPVLAADKTSTVKVVAVHDGDTITCLTDGKQQMKVRLDAIDAPELGQPFGQASKQTLSSMVFGKLVTVIEKKKDKYGRTIGHVIVDGRDTNLLMIEQGMAWHYKQFSKNARLDKAEADARAAKKGLWSNWRRGERGRKEPVGAK